MGSAVVNSLCFWTQSGGGRKQLLFFLWGKEHSGELGQWAMWLHKKGGSMWTFYTSRPTQTEGLQSSSQDTPHLPVQFSSEGEKRNCQEKWPIPFSQAHTTSEGKAQRAYSFLTFLAVGKVEESSVPASQKGKEMLGGSFIII